MKRVNRQLAKRLFEEGRAIYLLPCKWTNTDKAIPLGEGSFNDLTLDFQKRMCNTENGVYPHYYIEEV